tara:strand:- start:316 stop:678 length:363 start_codon:yes stop_codon:yes gene_type:complete
MNDGKSMSDLTEVVDDWNEGADENGLDACTAWVLNPILKADADFARETGWLGYAPMFTEMGEDMHAWITRGQKINERCKKVDVCLAKRSSDHAGAPTHRKPLLRCIQLQRLHPQRGCHPA